MAFREVDMWQILEILRRLGRGESRSAVARATGATRKTVGRYLKRAKEAGWTPDAGEPTEALAGAVWRASRPRSADATVGPIEAILAPHAETIRTWLEKGTADEGRGLRLTKVHELLRRQGVVVAYSSLHRFATRHCGFADTRRSTVRVADSRPGEVAEVDFGRLGLIPDAGGGERRRVLHALVVTLRYSRHQFVWTTHTQTLEDLITGLEHAWEWFGGVPARVVVDNLKAAVVKADRYAPTFQRTFEEYAAYRGFVIDPCIVRHPQGKGTVERQVRYVRDAFFAGETWRDRDHVQREVERWCRTTAGMRIHGTTRRRPVVVFENEEQAALTPLTRPRFDPPQWGRCVVHPDHHVQFQKAIYSLPTAFIGRQVDVRSDSRLVRIYVDGEHVKTHERRPPGGRSTDYTDYPAHQSAYAMRDPARLISAAELQGRHTGTFMERLLSGDFPWAKLRQGQKLLRLGKKYGHRRLDAACARALSFDVINVRRIEEILQQSLDAEPQVEQTTFEPPLPSRFARPGASFVHSPARGESR